MEYVYNSGIIIQMHAFWTLNVSHNMWYNDVDKKGSAFIW